MPDTHNESRAPGTIRVGLITDGDRMAAVTAAVRGCPLLELTAQAGMGPTDALPGVQLFDDVRVLVNQAGAQALVLATSTRQDVELGEMAIDLGLHIWQLPPLGRTFAEAAELAGRAIKRGTIHRVASWWEHVAENAWRELQWPNDFQPLFSEVRVRGLGPTVHSWRARSAETAGGVLADDGYGMLEALIAVRGLPESVTAATAKFRKRSPGVNRETEDAAVAILRYQNGMATIRATWDLLPLGQCTLHHGSEYSVTLSDQDLSVLDAAGSAMDTRPLPGGFLAADLLRFVEQVRSEARDRAGATLERHLAVTALLEAIYLSARTGQPETPRKFYEVQGWPEPHP